MCVCDHYLHIHIPGYRDPGHSGTPYFPPWQSHPPRRPKCVPGARNSIGRDPRAAQRDPRAAKSGWGATQEQSRALARPRDTKQAPGHQAGPMTQSIQHLRPPNFQKAGVKLNYLQSLIQASPCEMYSVACFVLVPVTIDWKKCWRAPAIN